MPFDDDIRESEDERLLDEGRRRLRTAGLTDAQVNEWIARARKRGGTIELSVEGLRAVYPWESSTIADYRCAPDDGARWLRTTEPMPAVHLIEAEREPPCCPPSCDGARGAFLPGGKPDGAP